MATVDETVLEASMANDVPYTDDDSESSIPAMAAVDETVLEASMANDVPYTDDDSESSIPAMAAVDETVLEASMANGVLFTDDDGTVVTELIEGDTDSSMIEEYYYKIHM